MTTPTLRRIKDDVIVTGPDIAPTKFKSRPHCGHDREVEPTTGCVVRAVIANLRLVAGVAFARSRSCGSAGRAT